MSNNTSKLSLITTGQAQKEVTANELHNAASPATLFAIKTLIGQTLNYYGGWFTKADGTGVDIANGQVTLTYSATNYFGVDGAGATSVNTTGFADGVLPLYTVVMGASAYTSYTDHRDGSHGNYTVRNSKKRIGAPAWASSMTLDWGKYDVIRITLAGATTMTFSGAVDGQTCMLELTQDATGSRTVTWPASVRWSSDLPVPVLSTAANKVDRLGFIYVGGAVTKYDGAAVVRGY